LNSKSRESNCSSDEVLRWSSISCSIVRETQRGDDEEILIDRFGVSPIHRERIDSRGEGIRSKVVESSIAKKRKPNALWVAVRIYDIGLRNCDDF
jgi:hypothetical protein